MKIEREPIGVGGSKKIFEDRDQPDKKIRAEYRPETVGVLRPEEIKSAYYLGKILNMLFPHNIPDIYEAGTRPTPYYKAEKIDLDSDHIEMRDMSLKDYHHEENSNKPEVTKSERSIFDIKEDERGGDPRVQHLVRELSDAGIMVDELGRNFSIDENGEAIYVDHDTAFYLVGNEDIQRQYDPVKLESYIIKNVEEPKRSRVLKFLYRIEELYKKAEKKYLKKE